MKPNMALKINEEVEKQWNVGFLAMVNYLQWMENIVLVPKKEEKGTFCYKVIPFGLKNAGATCQRAMVALFHDMMHKEIEVYVDSVPLIKSSPGSTLQFSVHISLG
ncbi:hypothetical protein CR513_25247, partial [Mucuna pruriens]